MSKHTPGPWYLRGSSIYRDAMCEYSIAKVHMTPDEDEEEMNANAALMRAAPDLLDAFQHALKAIETYPDKQHPMTASEIIIRKAIARATGWGSDE